MLIKLWNILLSPGTQQTFLEQTHVLNTNYWDPKSLFSPYQLISTTFITHQKATYMFWYPPISATRLRTFSRKVIHNNRSFYNTHNSPISKGTYIYLFKRWFIKNFGEWNNWELSNVKPSQTPWVNSMTFVNKGSKNGMFIDCRNLKNAIQRDTYSENDWRSDRELLHQTKYRQI